MYVKDGLRSSSFVTEAGLAVDVEILVATAEGEPEVNADVGESAVLDTWGSTVIVVIADGMLDTESAGGLGDIGSFVFPA